MTVDPVEERAARIARVLDVTEKRLSIEEAFAELDPIVAHDITDVPVIRGRVARAHAALARHIGRPTVPRRPAGRRRREEGTPRADQP